MGASMFDITAVGQVEKDMEDFNTAIGKHFAALTEYAGQLASCYSGEAADSFKSALSSMSDSLTTTMSSLITQINEQIADKETKYTQQDQNLVVSVNMGQN